MVFWIVLIFLLAVPAADAGPKVIANFSGTPRNGPVPLQVAFTDLSTGSPAGWAWYFGDETYREPWTRMNANSGWLKREGFTSVATPDGSIVLMGGTIPSTPPGSNWYRVNDTWRSTDFGRTWIRMNSSSGWTARNYHSSVAMPDNSIILMGGVDDTPGSLNDIWSSKNHGATWTLVSANAGWSTRTGHSSVVMPDGSIVLTGGWGTSSARNDTWRSTDYGRTWTRMNASSGWAARGLHSTAGMPDGSIILTGGNGVDSPSLYNDTWRSIDYGRTWIRMNASSGWGGRLRHTSVAMPDNSIILMGGQGEAVNATYNAYNDTWRSTNNGATWTLVNASPGWTKREGHASVLMMDSSIVLIGGIWYNDTWRFVPAGSTLQNPMHTYTRVDKFTVVLQAYNDGMYNSTRKKSYITPWLPLTKGGTGGGVTLPTRIQGP